MSFVASPAQNTVNLQYEMEYPKNGCYVGYFLKLNLRLQKWAETAARVKVRCGKGGYHRAWCNEKWSETAARVEFQCRSSPWLRSSTPSDSLSSLRGKRQRSPLLGH